jgi:hypothetical protein
VGPFYKLEKVAELVSWHNSLAFILTVMELNSSMFSKAISRLFECLFKDGTKARGSNMKKINLIGVAFLLCFLMTAPVHAQQAYAVVYELWYNLYLNPENGDNLIAQNQNVFDARFYSCLDAIQSQVAPAAIEHAEYCNQMVDPQMYDNCIKQNTGAQVWVLVQTMRAATSGQMRWSQTMYGQAAIVGKQISESVAPGMWAQIVQASAPMMQPILTCQY